MTVRNEEHKAKGALHKIGVRLYREDFEYLKEHYPDNYNAVIRRLVSNWIASDKRWKAAEHTMKMRGSVTGPTRW